MYLRHLSIRAELEGMHDIGVKGTLREEEEIERHIRSKVSLIGGECTLSPDSSVEEEVEGALLVLKGMLHAAQRGGRDELVLPEHHV